MIVDPKPVLPNEKSPKSKKIKCGNAPAAAPPLTRQRSRAKEPVLKELKNGVKQVLGEAEKTNQETEKPVLKQSKKLASKTRKSNEKIVSLAKTGSTEKPVSLDKKRSNGKPVLLKSMKKNRALEITQDSDYLTSDDEYVFIDKR